MNRHSLLVSAVVIIAVALGSVVPGQIPAQPLEEILSSADPGLPVTAYDPVRNDEDVENQWFGDSEAADADVALGMGGGTVGTGQ